MLANATNDNHITIPKYINQQGVHLKLLQCYMSDMLPFKIQLKINLPALAGMAQWIECRTAKQRVVGSIPSQEQIGKCKLGPPGHTMSHLSEQQE